MSIVPHTGVFRYARHHEAEAYCKLGWLPTSAFEGSYHENFSVLMAWLCDCKAVEPLKYSEQASVDAVLSLPS